MKKITLLIISAFVSFALLAQSNSEEIKAPKKDYSVFFPKSGTIVLGADAAQFVRFLGDQTFGRINSKPSENTPAAAYQGDLFGKYFLSNNFALRARLGLNFAWGREQGFVRDDYQFYHNPYAEDLTVDKFKHKDGLFEIGVGAEIRRSLWRLQGYAGAEVFLGYGYDINRFEYGNNITDFNQTPSTFDFSSYGVENIPTNPYHGRSYYRILNMENYKNFTYGASVFTGVDYFFNRNVSLGLEFGFQARGNYHGEYSGIVERWDNNRHEIREEFISPDGTSFTINPYAQLHLMFYF